MAARRKSPFEGRRMRSGRDTIYVVGHARLPAETSAKHVYDILSLGLALEKETKKIVEVSCTTLPPYGNEFIRDILLGKRLEEDLKIITEQLRTRYICRTRNALLAALDDLLKRLREHEKKPEQ
ncbi:MAG: DUF3870 domain-containing protein [Deltaproteobacteria bacterium]|nr:DUF3870 domain-containing protein [Deltaproteobacteria bacterium]